MNPYEATLTNVVARINAWLRGLLRHYRKPVLLAIFAAATVVAGVSAGRADGTSDKPAIIANR